MTTTHGTSPLTPPQADGPVDQHGPAAARIDESTRPQPGGTPEGHSADDMLHRVVQGAHDTVDRVAESAAPHLHSLQAGVESAGEALHQRSDQARALGEDWTEALRCSVREHPLAAVAAALVAGMVIARLSQR